MPNELTTQTVTFGDQGVRLTTLDDAWRFATAIKASKLVPNSYDSAEKVLVVMQTGMELGYSPMQAIRNMWPGPDGRPNEYVEASWARVLASGLVEDWSAEATNTSATFTVKRKGFKTPIVSTYSIDQARRAGLVKDSGNWVKYQERMLLARAKGFALKDGFADVLKGMAIAETRDEFYSGNGKSKILDQEPSVPDPVFALLDAPDNAVADNAVADEVTEPEKQKITQVEAGEHSSECITSDAIAEPTLRTPDGEVLPVDRKSFTTWSAAWKAAFMDIKNDPKQLIKQFTLAASDAAILFDDNQQIRDHIESLNSWAIGLSKTDDFVS